MPREPVTAVLGLGSNLGIREDHLHAAVVRLAALPGCELTAVATVWETEPVGGPEEQPRYLNTAVRLETTLAPEALLDACLAVERDLGRVRGVRWGPRRIDIDLLAVGLVRLAGPRLCLPHPRLAVRPFAHVPFCEAAPALASALGLPAGDRSAAGWGTPWGCLLPPFSPLARPRQRPACMPGSDSG